ncbi:MAG: hypothetical protein AAB436_04050 [Patescibacteria group bacterium]
MISSNSRELVVLKHGSSSVENSDGMGINQDRVNFHVAQHRLLRANGMDTVEVSSGGTVDGKEYATELGLDIADYENSELAALGTSGQIAHWREAGRPHALPVAQVLSTHEQIDEEAAGKNITEGILSLTRKGALVVVNESDIAAFEEMNEYEKSVVAKEQGETDVEPDNDWLAAHLAISLGASKLLLLGKMHGLTVEGKIVRELHVDDIPEMLTHCDGSSRSGTGGMASKLLAAEKAARAGIDVRIGHAFIDLNYLLSHNDATRVVQ